MPRRVIDALIDYVMMMLTMPCQRDARYVRLCRVV